MACGSGYQAALMAPTELLDLVAFGLTVLGAAALYHYVPHTAVRWRHALAGGLFVALGLDIAKRLLQYERSGPGDSGAPPRGEKPRHRREPEVRAQASHVLRDPPLDLRAEVPDQALHWPRRRITQRANRMAFDLFRDFQ